MTLGLIIFGFIAFVGGLCWFVERETRSRDRDLGRYRATHDDRYPHRDEFKMFMRDCK